MGNTFKTCVRNIDAYTKSFEIENDFKIKKNFYLRLNN
ncbi:hypothetical protein J2W55_003680 [Mucilaginibacter pocheonensis]|uniref:Uncharacterized protein n=1 Tax=Mucilaginibacter pocheonensis TaxID=398050 RepID=A0ABU1TEJ8_9SPHI|nr:hypothetical protein [Mucilaginibacter pocheonensis]